MPPDKPRTRPTARTGSHNDARGDGTTGRITVAADKRRRREAAGRLPPIATGYRDPLDALAGLPIPAHPQPCRGMFGAGGKWQPCCRGAA
jgi:hypothetical protein